MTGLSSRAEQRQSAKGSVTIVVSDLHLEQSICDSIVLLRRSTAIFKLICVVCLHSRGDRSTPHRVLAAVSLLVTSGSPCRASCEETTTTPMSL